MPTCLSHPLTQTFRDLMEKKKSNLSVAADTTHSEELIRIADLAGPSIVCLKTHIDILEDFSFDVISELRALSKKHGFLIFEDRKFADIGTTVKTQYEKGLYRIADWAEITNAHIVPGPGIIQGLKEAGLPRGNGLLLLAEMSSSGTLAEGDYTQKAVEFALEHPDFVIGFIATHRLIDDPRFLHFMPGIQLANKSDPLGQRYVTPREAIQERGVDIIIVGRGITKASDIASAAELYRREGWCAP